MMYKILHGLLAVDTLFNSTFGLTMELVVILKF